MKDLNYDLKKLCHRYCEGSFATYADRERILDLIANQLQGLGFKALRAMNLKPRHVDALVAHWHKERISAGTFKNRMSALRWYADKIGKVDMIARSNDAYGIPERVYVTNVSKAVSLDIQKLERVTDPYTAFSLKLQAAFGLRREESMKIEVAWADRGDRLVLRDSWTKGGREREIPITSIAQRELLNSVKGFAGSGSLIPKDLTYIEQRRRFEHQCDSAGIQKVHGIRHCYAQTRYEQLTGWACPARGGPTSKQLSAEQKSIDHAVRLTLSRELGHEREQITAVYLGR